MKLLGIILTSDLRWEANTDHICRKAYKNMWALRRMKNLDMDSFTILDYWISVAQRANCQAIIRY